MLQPGKRADINILDLEKLKALPPYWENDLPTGAGRWLQSTEGYHTTILRGVVTFENNAHTGELPGRLVRNPCCVGLENCIRSETVKAESLVKEKGARDMKDYAVNISQTGGASAMARVLGSRSRL